MDLERLGARQRPQSKIVDFGVYFPQITVAEGYEVSVKLIHEVDQFVEHVNALAFNMVQGEIHSEYGAYWHGSVDIGNTPSPPHSNKWGAEGRYLYRYEVRGPVDGSGNRKIIDWVADPYSREYGSGRMSAFTLGYQQYEWSLGDADWRVPDLRDLVVYELHLGEFNNGLQGAIDRLDYLKDLGVNCLEIMPVNNVEEEVEWGFQPLGHFGIDERFGKRSDMQRFVDEAHKRGIAVIFDVVFGHAGARFPYAYLYDSLALPNNPFHGALFGDDFGFGRRTKFGTPFVDDFFFTVCHHLLDCYHVDGFRYDCVPEYWDPIQMRGYHFLVYSTFQEAKQKTAEGAWKRFDGTDGEITLIQCAEQLKAPKEAVRDTYSNATWQNWTLDCALIIAKTTDAIQRGKAIRDFGFKLGLEDFPKTITMNSNTRLKTAFQYIETHDKPRFVNSFGQSGEGLLASGNRDLWYKVQPYLIALLLADGVPMLWQGQELCENNSLPDGGDGRIRFFRPVHWEYFYDHAGKGTLWLTRHLIALRNQQPEFRRGEYYFFNDWYNYLSRGVLVYRRRFDEVDSIVAVNFGDSDQAVWISFERAGNYREGLHKEPRLISITKGEWRSVVIPSNYGRVWTREP